MSKKENENINFEETIKELEKIIQELEKGELNLEESINKYEKGMGLAKKCNDFLEDAEKRITKLIKNASGEIEEKNFEN